MGVFVEAFVFGGEREYLPRLFRVGIGDGEGDLVVAVCEELGLGVTDDVEEPRGFVAEIVLALAVGAAFRGVVSG